MPKSKKAAKKAAKPQIPTEKTEFTLFPKFPGEIRDMIWAKSIPGSHVVEVYIVERHPCEPDGSYTYNGQYEMRASYKVPVMLQVCQESRIVARKVYTQILVDEFKYRPVYLNTALDILHLRDGRVFEHICSEHGFRPRWTSQQIIQYLSFFQGFRTVCPIIHQLRCLQIGADFPWHWHVLRSYMKLALQAFGSPELVVLTKPLQRGKRRDWRLFKFLKERIDKEWGIGNGNDNDKYKPELLILSMLKLKKMIVSLCYCLYKNIWGQKARTSTRVINLELSLY
jgi:hypothetical protein